MNSSADFETIAQLLADSQKGYSEASQIADDPQVKQMFADRAQQRAAMMQEMEHSLPGLGTRRDEEGTAAGAAHRVFINLRRMVQDDTRVALVEVERGEATFLETLQDAVNDTSLTSDQRGFVGRLIEQVSADHDRFASMKAMF
jgi:uncharacterized protein (TIGR02284 family)